MCAVDEVALRFFIGLFLGWFGVAAMLVVIPMLFKKVEMFSVKHMGLSLISGVAIGFLISTIVLALIF